VHVRRKRRAPDYAALHERARRKGVNPIVYWLARAVLQPFFHLYFRLSRIGREHVPQTGPVIYASNHRSFLDPFVIGTIARRPIYYVAKKELFANPVVAWLLNALGAFPVDRGASDKEMLATAKAILDRGDSILMFPEGTRIRPGALGKPKRGTGRLVLESGAPVVPVAVFGTEAVRNGWRFRPHKVRIRIGPPLTFPKAESPSRELAAAVTDRIWPCVMLQWEWLGGLPPLRRAAVIGAGSWGTSVALMLARAGIQVDLGCRTREQAERLAATRRNERYLPEDELPDTIAVMRASELELSRHDVVFFAVPAVALPSAIAEHSPRIPERTGVLLVAKGLVPPLGTLPSAYVAERTKAWAVGVVGGPAHPHAARQDGVSLVVASANEAFRRQIADALTAARLDVAPTADVVGVELAGCAKDAAALAAAAAATVGPNAAGAAAGKVFAEVDAFALANGARPETFAGVAGAGDLVATVLAEEPSERRAAELLVPLLAERLRGAGLDAPVLDGLAELIEGRVEAAAWTASLTTPRASGSPQAKAKATAA
jgi:glycerol-3-phosphate dehydrogenase (NAD(P)+)